MKKKKQKNKRWVQVYSTTIRNVALKVNFCTNHKTNITSLNGYLIDVKTRIRHDADVSVSTSVQDARDIDRMVKVLIARATAVYEKKCTAATPDGTAGLTKIYNSLSASDTALLCPPKMLAASSRRHTLSYFRSFCMKVDALGIAICQENAGQIAKLIRDMTESSKKSKGTTVTETTILQHIRAVEWQLDRLAEIRPDAPIKPLILPRDRAKSVAPEAEQQKYIGEAATVLTVATLRRLVGNGLSLGGILMLLGMARTAEACAPQFGEIVLRDDYAVIAIVWQADGTTRIADLKTDNSYRLIILPKIAAEAIRARILVGEDEFGASLPEAGDECVLMGNTENPLRQNLILISATEDGQPRVDVMDVVKAKNFTGCLRARLGNLDGISDDWFPSDNQPHGDGLYSDNAYLRGTFLLVTGEDIKTKFEIVEGKIVSSVTALRNDFATERGYLNNPAFDDGLMKWNTENETVFFLVGNRWIWANGNVLTRKGDSASVTEDDGRTVVRIRNKYILQKRENLKSIPSMPENDSGEKEAVPVFLTFFYRCAKAGTLRVEFVGVDKTGFANFNSMEVEEELSATDGYVQYTCSGLWNGTGDFKLSFTGDIYLYMLILSTDRVESLTHRYKTLFEQSERLVKISAAVFDKDENLLEETGLMVTSKYSGLYAIDGDGNLKSLVGVGGDGVKIKGDNITLEGLVTANDNFKILEDGSIETRNAKIYGTVYAYEGKIGGFTIDSGRLYWKAGDYFGNDSRSLKLGVSQTDMEGIVDVSFNAATQGRFGVKAVGSNLGGAAIYASSKSSGQSYPISANTYAGYFDGGVHVNGAVYCGDILSNNYGTGWSLASDGTYSYRKGVSGTFQWAVKSDFITYNYTLEVVNGIVVKMTYI